MEISAKKNTKTVQGKVVSTAMAKTVVIEVEERKLHKKFKKITKVTKRIKVHDEKSECKDGDIILALETRPLSREKRHKLLKVVEKAK